MFISSNDYLERKILSLCKEESEEIGSIIGTCLILAAKKAREEGEERDWFVSVSGTAFSIVLRDEKEDKNDKE